MKKAKIRTLSVRPHKSADLTFAMPGILAWQGRLAELGSVVASPTEARRSLARLLDGDEATKSPEESDFVTAREIERHVRDESLFILRNDRMAVDLDQSIANHAAVYLQRFADSGAIGPILRAENARRSNDLDELKKLFEQRHKDLDQSYRGKNPGVVSVISSLSRHEGDSPAVVKTFSAPTQLHTTAYRIHINGGGIPATMTHDVPDVVVSPKTFKAGSYANVSEELTVKFDAATPTVTGVLTQVSETIQKPVATVTELTEHAHPFIDEQVGSVAALGELDASHEDRQVRAMKLKHFEAVVEHENDVTRLDVKKRQFAYLDTFLLAPFAGTITAVYKDVGEYVQAGEPVLRIENDDRLRLVGLVQFKGLVSLGDQVALKVKNVFEGGDELQVIGHVVSVRGHDADDDEWDLVIDVDNSEGQLLTGQDRAVDRIKLPLNLQFDRFETEMSIGRPS